MLLALRLWALRAIYKIHRVGKCLDSRKSNIQEKQTSVTSTVPPLGWWPTLWSIRLCSRLTSLYVLKAFRTDNHLLSRKKIGTGIPQSYCGFRFRIPEYNEHHSKVSHTNFLVSQGKWKLCLHYTVPKHVCNSIMPEKKICTDFNLKIRHC